MSEYDVIDTLLKRFDLDPEDHRHEVSIEVKATKDGVVTAHVKAGSTPIKTMLTMGVVFAGMVDSMGMDEDTFISFCHVFFASVGGHIMPTNIN